MSQLSAGDIKVSSLWLMGFVLLAVGGTTFTADTWWQWASAREGPDSHYLKVHDR